MSVIDVDILKTVKRAAGGNAECFSLDREMLYVNDNSVEAVSVISAENPLASLYQWCAEIDQDRTQEITARFSTDLRPDFSDLISVKDSERIERKAAISLVIAALIDLRNSPIDLNGNPIPVAQNAFRIVPPISIDELIGIAIAEESKLGAALSEFGVLSYERFERGRFVLTPTGEEMFATEDPELLGTDADLAVITYASDAGTGEPVWVKSVISGVPWISRTELVHSIGTLVKDGILEFIDRDGNHYPAIRVEDDVTVSNEDLGIESEEEVTSSHEADTEPEDAEDDDGEEYATEDERVESVPEEESEVDLIKDGGEWDDVLADVERIREHVTDMRVREKKAAKEIAEVSKEMYDLQQEIVEIDDKLSAYDSLVAKRRNAAERLSELAERKEEASASLKEVNKEKSKLLERVRAR